MTAVDSSVRGFSIAFYPPTAGHTIFLLVALAAALAAGMWLGMRFYLRTCGVLTEGRVIKSFKKTESVRPGGEFSGRTWINTHKLTIEYTDRDGVKHTVKGTRYTTDKDNAEADNPQAGGKVPVLYSRNHPGCAVYYDPVWHYLSPVALLVIGLFLTVMAADFCYRDIRTSNHLALSDRTREHYREYQDVVIECDDAIYRNPDNAAAYERRGDAWFALAQFSDAIKDYSEALRLRPGSRELLLKRAKAEWLDGLDRDALRDWLKSR